MLPGRREHETPRLAIGLTVAGLCLEGCCLGLVVTMVQPLLALIAQQRSATRAGRGRRGAKPSVAELCAVSDSFQSIGFVVGPLLGGWAVGHARLEPLLGAMSLASAVLAWPLWKLGKP